MSFRREKKEEEDGGGNPFANLDKTSVLQEARTFNDTPVNPRKCTHILTKILYLLNQGEQFGTVEATDTFFAMTKLFQSKDIVLRRMVYLGIKELSTVAEDVIIVTSSLTKDMTGREDVYRAAAIRALCSITDASMLQAIERYMKQAIVDRNSNISSAALTSSLHMTKTANEVVKRWVNEVQEALNSENVMVQYHALGLLYHLRKSDRLAVTKLVSKYTKRVSLLKSPFAICLLIRIVCKLLDGDDDDTVSNSPLFDFIKACLRNKSETVVYEAAHAVVNLRKTSSSRLAPAISVLQLFCSSPKPTLRFAAVRTLNKVAMSHPSAITTCNMDLENLISDSNRSIATLAITTLLKTGAESSVDRLMKQISSFVNEISDEFKIVVVQAIRALGEKFPRKYNTLMNFLSGMLRDEGGLDYKAAIADTIITIIKENPDAKDTGLAHLCEFIEDCEHTSLAARILHLLGKEGPRSKQPSKYIRFIYNRVILENSVVRAAAVSALAQFGAVCSDLLPNILVLLERCQMDSDDEVRDRATYFCSVLAVENKLLYNPYIIERPQISIGHLEKLLCDYLDTPTVTPFDISVVPYEAQKPRTEIKPDILSESRKEEMHVVPDPNTAPRKLSYGQRLKALPELSFIKESLFRSSTPVELTESETEYVVKCVKHCFASYIVFQFECMNTLNDQMLENVRVKLEVPEGYELIKEIPCPKLTYGEIGNLYIVLAVPKELSLSLATFEVTLKFIVKDCDPVTSIPDSEEGYDDEYMLEDVEVTLSDQMLDLPKADFYSSWEAAAQTHFELQDTYSLSNISSVEDAVKNLISFLGMSVADRTDKVPAGKLWHTLNLSGIFRNGHDVMARIKFVSGSDGVTMNLTLRCTNPLVGQFISSIIG